MSSGTRERGSVPGGPGPRDAIRAPSCLAGGMPVSRGTCERGSVLMLVPAGLLVVLVLASIAVDFSVVHLRRRQAFDLAAAAANDGVTAGADPQGLRRGEYVLDPGRTADTVAATIEASELGPETAWSYRATPAGLEVTVTVRADYIFAGVVPGAPDGTEVTATASATAPAG